jgi:hypothetical protein
MPGPDFAYIGLRAFFGAIITLSMFWNFRDYSFVKLVYLVSAFALNLLLLLYVEYYERKASGKTHHAIPGVAPTADELGLLKPRPGHASHHE